MPGRSPASRGAHARTRTPFRQRLVARTRLISFAGILVVVALALALSWVVGASMGAAVWTLAVVHAGALVALTSIAWLVARRSSRVVEVLFREEDRTMLAVVHEINRPLSRLVAAVDEGLMGMLPAEAALKETSRHADELRELIEALLEAARVATGAIPLPHEPVRLDRLAAEIEATDAPGASTLALETVPTMVHGSSQLLKLAVTNVVRNAAQHAYHGRGGVIGLRVDRRGLTVVDDGPGIDEAALRELQSREVWVGLRRARIGLGLAIAAWVAEVHDGEIRLDNRPQGGLEVALELPVQPVVGATGLDSWEHATSFDSCGQR